MVHVYSNIHDDLGSPWESVRVLTVAVLKSCRSKVVSTWTGYNHIQRGCIEIYASYCLLITLPVLEKQIKVYNIGDGHPLVTSDWSNHCQKVQEGNHAHWRGCLSVLSFLYLYKIIYIYIHIINIYISYINKHKHKYYSYYEYWIYVYWIVFVLICICIYSYV